MPFAVKKKANKAPNERAEIAPPHSAPAKGRGGAGQAVFPCFGLLFDYWGLPAIKARGIFIPHTQAAMKCVEIAVARKRAF